MKITIQEIENSIKNIFKDADVLNTDSVYEEINNSNNLKLVIFINKLFEKDISVLYTKIIFVVDKNKKKLINNSFLYLYDINCKYINVDFLDIDDFENKMKNIIKNEKFGNDLKILSKFIEKPAFLINTWFKDNKINEINILNIKYDPKMYIMPCKSLSFSFNININNNNITFNIKKEKNNVFIFSFLINNETINIEKPNLKTLVETIGTTLKNKLTK
jgi:hypothetical protein